MIDHPTHGGALGSRPIEEDTARLAANQAMTAAQLEKSRSGGAQGGRAEAMLARTKKTMEFKTRRRARDDVQGVERRRAEDGRGVMCPVLCVVGMSMKL